MSIRTTLTLEDDVAQRLEAEARRTGTSLTLALEQGAVLATHDRDFARFDGLRTVMPLAG